MSRAAKVLLAFCAAVAIAGLASACGTQTISVPKSRPVLFEGATLFNQRCSGCHTLSYAATHGSAANVHTAQFNNGPDFDLRCERPVTRVLYAIENGGFSGGIMPQNVVVGQQAQAVAMFVATYAGRQEPLIPGVTPCKYLAVGTLPPPPSLTASTTTPAAPAATPATPTAKVKVKVRVAAKKRKP